MRMMIALPGEYASTAWEMPLSGGSYETVEAVNTRLELFARLHETYDAIAVHTGVCSDLYPWDWMPAIRRLQPRARIIIALDEKTADSLMLEIICRLAEDLSFSIVPAGQANTQVLRQCYEFLNNDQGKQQLFRESVGKGKVIAVWSAASKDGATTVAASLALALSLRRNLRIGLIDANLRNPELKARFNLKDKGMSPFTLRSKLQTQRLRPEDLAGACQPYRHGTGLYILPGSPRRDMAQDMTPEMMIHLLSAARSAFDITVVDVNSYPDNAATIVAVREANVRLLVSQNRYASYKTSWSEWYACFWSYCGLSPKDVSLVINRAETGSKPERMADYLGMSLAGILPNVPGGLGIVSEEEGVPLYGRTKAEAFSQSIDGLAETLVPLEFESALTASPLSAPRKSGWFTRWTARFG